MDDFAIDNDVFVVFSLLLISVSEQGTMKESMLG